MFTAHSTFISLIILIVVLKSNLSIVDMCIIYNIRIETYINKYQYRCTMHVEPRHRRASLCRQIRSIVMHPCVTKDYSSLCEIYNRHRHTHTYAHSLQFLVRVRVEYSQCRYIISNTLSCGYIASIFNREICTHSSLFKRRYFQRYCV